MTYDELLDLLNLDRVVEAVTSTGLKQCDLADCVSMILKAIKKWGPSDYETLTVDAIEQRFLLVESVPGGPFLYFPDISSDGSRSYGHRAFKGFLDLAGARALPSGLIQREVTDWKTAGTIDAAQQDRLRFSWQGKLYSYAYQADVMVYRTVNREGRAVELRLDWPRSTWYPKDVERYMRQTLDFRDSQLKDATWIQHAPYACNAYGRACRHVDGCIRHNNLVQVETELRPLSHSSAETLLLCPERYRRDQQFPIDDRSDETDLGKAFHAGVACAWQQIKDLQSR